MDSKPRQQPVSDIGADDADDQIADDSIPGAPHDLAGQPSGDDADHDDHKKALIRHFVSLVSSRTQRRHEPLPFPMSSSRRLWSRDFPSPPLAGRATPPRENGKGRR